MQRLSALSGSFNREIAVCLTRDGEIIDVAVGTDQDVQLRDCRLRRNRSRLSRVRLIHTHPNGDGRLSDVVMSALKLFRYDAMVAVGCRGGEPTWVQAAFLTGEEETPLRRFLVSCLTGESETGYLLFHVADVLPIQNLIENLLYTLLEDTPNKRGILQLTMGLLFAQLVNHTQTLQVDTAEQNTVVSVLRYVEAYYRDGSLCEIAAQLHYDLPYLSRLIRQETGHSYTELVQEKRLSQAAWLLRNSALRVDEVARSVGYENISFFHRLFRARFSLSPKAYRDSK
jgi:AraC-like DNA-binding protein